MIGAWHQLQSASKPYLWLAWATAAWAVLSYSFLHWHVRLPHALELLTALARGFSLFGGFLAVLYLVLGARRPAPILSGVAAAAINFWYCRAYLRSLFGI